MTVKTFALLDDILWGVFRGSGAIDFIRVCDLAQSVCGPVRIGASSMAPARSFDHETPRMAVQTARKLICIAMARRLLTLACVC